MVIKQLQNDVETHWDEFVCQSSQATFFHLTAWKKVVETTFGYKPVYLYAEECGQVRGLLPVFLVNNLLARRCLISLPFAAYGGIIAEDEKISLRLLEAVTNLLEDCKGNYVELRHTANKDFGLPCKDLYVTFQREIYEDLDKNMAAIPRKQRRMVRQGMAHGLTATIGGEDYLPQFYALYAHSVRNLGTPVFPFKFFANIQRMIGQNCRILAVWHETKMVGAVMTFFFKDTVMPYYAGALRSYSHLSVNDFMYWELLRYGCEQGYKVFDFGRSKRGTGAFDFKRHWGFEPTPLYYQYYLRKGNIMPNVSPANPKYEPFIRIWKKLPLPVANFIGPQIIKYFP